MSGISGVVEVRARKAQALSFRQIEMARELVVQQFPTAPGAPANDQLVVAIAQLIATNYVALHGAK